MAKTQTPVLDCACGAPIELEGKRIGDGVRCPQCWKLRVVLRSKEPGYVPPATGAPSQARERQAEVQASLDRIRIRRAGRAARDVALYPTWAILLGGWLLGVFTGGYLASQNMVAVGKLVAARARRTVLLLALAHAGLFLLVLGWRAGTLDAFQIPPDSDHPLARAAFRVVAIVYVAGVGLALPLALALGGAPVVREARAAGARVASPLVPLLVGFLLLIAQAFAVQFVALAARPL